MLRYLLTEGDVGSVRFGISPLCELGLSSRAIREPARFPLQLGGCAAPRRLGPTSTCRAHGLIDERLWTPDFLNPRPDVAAHRLDDELEPLAATPAGCSIGDLVRGARDGCRTVFAGSPKRGVRRVIRALRRLWDTCFAPYWPRMRAVLEADVVLPWPPDRAVRACRRCSTDSRRRVDYDHGVVSVRSPTRTTARRRSTGSASPSCRRCSRAAASAPVGDGPPMIMYSGPRPGRALGDERVANPAAVAAVLGETRASLLAALGDPASSTELGVRLGVTASAVNQHLRALRDAGLLVSTRYGRSVLYLRSELGSALLEARAG
jgi:DNA-binding transcriptional ArsR family regulator